MNGAVLWVMREASSRSGPPLPLSWSSDDYLSPLIIRSSAIICFLSSSESSDYKQLSILSPSDHQQLFFSSHHQSRQMTSKLCLPTNRLSAIIYLIIIRLSAIIYLIITRWSDDYLSYHRQIHQMISNYVSPHIQMIWDASSFWSDEKIRWDEIRWKDQIRWDQMKKSEEIRSDEKIRRDQIRWKNQMRSDQMKSKLVFLLHQVCITHPQSSNNFLTIPPAQLIPSQPPQCVLILILMIV